MYMYVYIYIIYVVYVYFVLKSAKVSREKEYAKLCWAAEE